MGMVLVVLLMGCAFSRRDIIIPGSILMAILIGIFIFCALKRGQALGFYTIPLIVLLFGLGHVIGFGGGNLSGWLLGRLLYDPQDTRRVKSEHSIAKSHVKFGRYQEAIEQFQKDFAENPKDQHILWEMASIYAYNINEYSRG